MYSYVYELLKTYITCTVDYIDELMEKTMHFFTSDDDKPSLPTPPPPLASKYIHPDKDTIPLFSRYK